MSSRAKGDLCKQKGLKFVGMVRRGNLNEGNEKKDFRMLTIANDVTLDSNGCRRGLIKPTLSRRVGLVGFFMILFSYSCLQKETLFSCKKFWEMNIVLHISA